MKLPCSKIYWADFLSFSAILSDKEICQVLKIIALKAMSYQNPQDNQQDNPQVSKLILKLILKLNQIQLNFYECMDKALNESAKSYIASIRNGRLGGRPKKIVPQSTSDNISQQVVGVSSEKEPELLVLDCLKDSKTKQPKVAKHIPENWQPKETTIAKLKEKGVIIDKAIEQFVNSCHAKGYKYVDFDRAILSWNWEKNGLVEKSTSLLFDDELRAKL